MTILVTGCAGFIGSHVSRRLLQEGQIVVGLDNLNNYYDVSLKKDRLNFLKHKNFKFVRGDIVNSRTINRMFEQWQPKVIIHLAAQAGVRYSLDHPQACINSNIVGFTNMLEASRTYGVEHFIYASTSSVYGLNTHTPFSTHHSANHPISIYAVTKKTNELLAHTYSHLYELPTTGLRFFTVYGPWGRPDMALFIFTKAILEGKPIRIFNAGKMKRDFTYIDDIVDGIIRLIQLKPQLNPNWSGLNPDPGSGQAPYKIYNIGNNNPVDLMTFIETIEEKLGKSAIKQFLPLQPGDVPETCADIFELMKDTGFKPVTPIDTGVGNFIDWYQEYYNV